MLFSLQKKKENPVIYDICMILCNIMESNINEVQRKQKQLRNFQSLGASDYRASEKKGGPAELKRGV